jgi:FtsH-binding integral membrane protein
MPVYSHPFLMIAVFAALFFVAIKMQTKSISQAGKFLWILKYYSYGLLFLPVVLFVASTGEQQQDMLGSFSLLFMGTLGVYAHQVLEDHDQRISAMEKNKTDDETPDLAK